MPKKSKHTEAGFSPNLTDSSCLRVAQMPRSPKVAIFVPTTTDVQTDYFTPCACARGNEILREPRDKATDDTSLSQDQRERNPIILSLLVVSVHKDMCCCTWKQWNPWIHGNIP